MSITGLLPAGVAVAERFDDPSTDVLLPAERALVARAVPRRQREFAAGRACARAALAGLGFPPVPVLRGPDREPLWPAGVTGSITHCDGYRAAAVAHTARVSAIGLDAEPNERLRPRVLRMVSSSPAEAARVTALLAERPGVCWDRLLFSAKESVFKAWFPLARRWLDFDGADVRFTPAGDGTGTFTARLLVPGPVSGFTGRWAVSGALLVTAIAVPARVHVPAPVVPALTKGES